MYIIHALTKFHKTKSIKILKVFYIKKMTLTESLLSKNHLRLLSQTLKKIVLLIKVNKKLWEQLELKGNSFKDENLTDFVHLKNDYNGRPKANRPLSKEDNIQIKSPAQLKPPNDLNKLKIQGKGEISSKLILSQENTLIETYSNNEETIIPNKTKSFN